MMTSVFLGIDLGTSGLKLALVDADSGSITAETDVSYTVDCPAPGHAETDPKQWRKAFDEAIEKLSPLPIIRAIGFAGQMHGIVVCDNDGNPLRSAILWPDQRADNVLQKWCELSDKVKSELANPLVAGMAGPTLTWLSEHEPEIMSKAAYIASPKDWLRRTMTGDCKTERTDASSSLLYNVCHEKWSQEALTISGISEKQLPTFAASAEVVGEWIGVPVVTGGGDTPCILTTIEAICSNSHSLTNQLIISIGTGIQVIKSNVSNHNDRPPVPYTQLMASTTAGQWHEMLALKNGCLALDWAYTILGYQNYTQFLEAAIVRPVGSNGAVFVPFITGERGNIASPTATGSWARLTPSVTRDDMARAVFEAMAFSIRRSIEVMLSPGDNSIIESLLVTGGGARSPWLRQLVADVTHYDLKYVELRSASAVGAALLAARGIGESFVPQASVTKTTSRPSSELDIAYDNWLIVCDQLDPDYIAPNE